MQPPVRAAALECVQGLALDMDGVLWSGESPAPGLVGFFSVVDDLGIAVVLATNNSSQTPEWYAAKLARFGVRLEADSVVTSAVARPRER